MHTHAYFLGDEFQCEVTPDELNHYNPYCLVWLPYDYWTAGHSWTWVNRRPVPDLNDMRTQCWATIKAARDRAEHAGCDTLLGRVDTDPESQRKVNGAVTMALIAAGAGQPFSIGWTMQDNSAVEHDGAAMIAMGAAVGGHVARCHSIALAKRELIAAAGTRAAIEAVDIEGGWGVNSVEEPTNAS